MQSPRLPRFDAPRWLALVALGFACQLPAPGHAAPFGEAGDVKACPTFTSQSSGLPTLGEWRTQPALGDVNGDGLLDLAGMPRKQHGPHVWVATPELSWKHSGQGLALPASTCGVGVDFGDVNGDGNLDLGVADHCSGLHVFLGDGKGAWRKAPRIRSQQGWEDLQFGDLNGDGRMDFAAASSTTRGLATYLGNGEGRFKKVDMGLLAHGRGTDVELADLNGDGSLDIVAAILGDGASGLPRHERNLPVWFRDPKGRFVQASNGIPGDRSYRGVSIGDVNGDGFLDLALTHAGYSLEWGPMGVYLGDGKGNWTPHAAGLPESAPRLKYYAVELTDLNRDGHLDLVATRHFDAQVQLWRGDGTGVFEACPEAGFPEPLEDIRGWGIEVGDVNGDGKLDLATGFGRDGNGSLSVWIQD